MTLPTFVVIGAMKAGTVSLRHYLDEHPEVFVANGDRFGEPSFFVAEFNWPRGRSWYESFFDGADGATAIGECSPSYTWAHVFRGVPPPRLTSTGGVETTARWTSPCRACTMSAGYRDARSSPIRAGDPISAPGWPGSSRPGRLVPMTARAQPTCASGSPSASFPT